MNDFYHGDFKGHGSSTTLNSLFVMALFFQDPGELYDDYIDISSNINK